MNPYAIIMLSFLLMSASVLVGHTYSLWKIARIKNQVMMLRRAVQLFRFQRELAEARFVSHAMKFLEPQIWLWDEADFGNEVLFARNKYDGYWYAYMPVTVEMNRPIRHKHLPKNSLFLRQVTVIFRFSPESELWLLTDHTFFNQTPNDILQKKSHELHMISSLHAHDEDFLK
ncbi:MAG: hypothetical protein LBQ54_06885 [Planctomycetaceae bacterium]|jgi:hypothetical protein|nr:hypothetical protein [Planctomycetaceae bacterium]